MDKLIRKFLCVLSVICSIGIATTAAAAIEVTIFDGTAKKGPASPLSGFNFRKITYPLQDTTLILLSCSTRPCSIGFPSGQEGGKADDTFLFSDHCGKYNFPACNDTETPAATVARVVKTASTTGRLELQGLDITAVKGKRVEIVYSTAKFDMKSFSYGPPYPVSVMLDGTFTEQPPTNSTGTLASSCPNPDMGLSDTDLLKPCANLRLEIWRSENIFNTIKEEMNEDGDRSIFSVSVACDPDNVNDLNPCGDRPEYNSQGELYTTDSPKLKCEGFCLPWHVATLTANFTAAKQTLAVVYSAVAAMSNITESDFGREDIAVSLAAKNKSDLWISYAASQEPYRTGEPSFTMTADRVTAAFTLQKAHLIPFKKAKQGLALTSIATTKDGKNGDNALPLTERLRNDRSYASYIPKPGLLWGKVSELKLSYDFERSKDPSPSEDDRLGSLIFSDCFASSFYVRVALRDNDGNDAGILIVNLGKDKNGTSDCQSMLLVDLMTSPLVDEPRVDATRIARKPMGYISLSQSKAAYGDLFVRSISVVVDRGISTAVDFNYKAVLKEAIVNGTKASDSLRVVDKGSYTNVKTLPTTGRSIVFSQLDRGLNMPDVVVPDDGIKLNDKGQLSASVPTVNFIKGVKYRVDFCALGRCLPTQGALLMP